MESFIRGFVYPVNERLFPILLHIMNKDKYNICVETLHKGNKNFRLSLYYKVKFINILLDMKPFIFINWTANDQSWKVNDIVSHIGRLVYFYSVILFTLFTPFFIRGC